jgi:ribosomal protein S18 acetylase RimI-like enzyme
MLREPDLPHDVAGIRYSVCDPSDIAEMGRVLAATFTRHDPPAVAVGLTPAEFEDFVAVVSQSAGTDRLTIIARNLASGAMAGVLLAEDAATAFPDGMDRLSAKFDPIFDLFGQLDEQIDEERPSAPGVVLHLFLLGVDERFARQGIAQALVRSCVANGYRMGYRTAVTEATNRVSQHVFGKLGFSSRAECSYASYRRDGVPVFASIAEHGGPKAMIRDIAVVP